jgi:hypothetical protein
LRIKTIQNIQKKLIFSKKKLIFLKTQIDPRSRFHSSACNNNRDSIAVNIYGSANACDSSKTHVHLIFTTTMLSESLLLLTDLEAALTYH